MMAQALPSSRTRVRPGSGPQRARRRAQRSVNTVKAPLVGKAPLDGMSLSTSGLVKNAAAAVTNPLRYWDASTVAYGAKPPPGGEVRSRLWRFRYRHPQGHRGPPAPSCMRTREMGTRLVQMSRFLFTTLFPRNDQEEHPVAFIVFPGSQIQSHPKYAGRRHAGRLLTDLSKAANIDTVLGLMASGLPLEEAHPCLR